MWDYDEKTVSWADLWAFDLLQHVNEARGNDGVDDDDDEGDDYDGDSRGGLSNTNLQVHDGLKSDKNEVQGNPRGVTMAARARDASNAAATTLIIEKQKDRQRVRPLRRASVGGGESRLFIDMTVGLCQREGLLEALGADPVRFREMIELLEMEYPDNPYHCALHAADVLWSAHALFKALPAAARGAFTPAEVMGLYLAAAGHDAGHFRKNNAFLKNSGHELAAVYPTSTLENFHAAAVLKLMRDPRCGVVGWSRLEQHGGGDGDADGVGGGTEGVSGGEAAKEFSSDGAGAGTGAGALMDLVKELILATDMVRGGYVCRF